MSNTFRNSWKKHGLYFSQDEVGYIALHIAGAMERNSISDHRKYRVILVCGTGRAMSRIIEAKINKYYQETIEVVDRLSYVELQQQDLTTIDFVITTVPLEQLSIPHVYINMAKLDKEIVKSSTSYRVSPKQMTKFIPYFMRIFISMKTWKIKNSCLNE